MRRALAPLGGNGRAPGACSCYATCARRGTAVYAGGGSIGIVGAARVGLMAADDPDDNDRTAPGARRRQVEPCRQAGVARVPARRRRIVRSRPRRMARRVGHTADHLTATAEGDRGACSARLKDWLSSVLADGPMLKRDVVKQACAEGIKETTLKRASQRLRVSSERDDSQQGRPATCSLPGYGSPVTGQHGMMHNPQPAEQGKRSEIEGYGSMS